MRTIGRKAPESSGSDRLAIAEVLLTNGTPTVAEIAAIEAYGMARYGGGLFA